MCSLGYSASSLIDLLSALHTLRKMNHQFAFVSIDGDTGKVKGEDRNVVRSRCMRGKNKREDSRRSLREARRSKGLPLRNPNQSIRSSLEDVATATLLVANSESLDSPDSPDDNPEPNSTSRDSDLVTVTPNRAGQRHSSPGLNGEIIRFMSEDTPIYPREMAFMSE
jgi:hypothetical protein